MENHILPGQKRYPNRPLQHPAKNGSIPDSFKMRLDGGA